MRIRTGEHPEAIVRSQMASCRAGRTGVIRESLCVSGNDGLCFEQPILPFNNVQDVGRVGVVVVGL